MAAPTSTSATRTAGMREDEALVLALSVALARMAVEIARRTARERAVLPRPRLLPRPGMVGRTAARAVLLPAAAAVVIPVAIARRATSVLADRLVPFVAESVLSRLDVPALARDYARLDRVAALIDPNAIARRVDLDEIAARIDVDAVADRVDVDRLLASTDLAGLARYIADEIDLPGLLRATSGSVTGEMVRGLREQGVGADLAVARAVDRFLRRNSARAASPVEEQSPEAESPTTETAAPAAEPGALAPEPGPASAEPGAQPAS